MAPREKSIKKIKSTLVKTMARHTKSPRPGVKTTLIAKNNTDEVIKGAAAIQPRSRTSTVSEISTPKPKEKKIVPLPGSVSKSAKKDNWKRRPKPAHSGVPVPEKYKQLQEKQSQDPNCSL